MLRFWRALLIFGYAWALATTTDPGVDSVSTSNVTSYGNTEFAPDCAFTPAVGDLIVVAMATSGSVEPTAAGALTDDRSGTYYKAGTANRSGNASTIYWFVREQLVTTANLHTLTFTCTGDAATGAVAVPLRISGMSRVGAQAVRQFKATNGIAAAGTPAVTFDEACLTGNPTLLALGSAANPPAVTPPTNWTERADAGIGTPAQGLEVATRDSGHTTGAITYGSTTGGAAGLAAIELDTSAAPEAISFTDDVDRTTYTTGSVTFSNGTLPTVFVRLAENLAAGEASTAWTVTDSLGGSWTKIVRALCNTSHSAVELWIRDTVSSGSAMTITASHASETIKGCMMSALGVPGMTRTGANAIKSGTQFGKQDNTAPAAPTPALPASCTTTNYTLGAVINSVNPAAMTRPASWSELHDIGHATPLGGLETVYRASGFTGTTVTWGSSSATQFGAIIAELDLSAAAQTVAVGQATETDTAQAIGHKKTRAVTQAAETDTAQAVTVRHTRAVVQATETDTAQAVGHKKTRAVGQATEIDTAQVVTVRQPITVAVGQATETDSAQSVTARHTRSVTQATETDTAQAVAARHTRAVGQAAETDTAQSVTGRKVRSVVQASETDSAQAITARRTVAVAQAVETDTAQTITARQPIVVAIGQTTETDTAQVVGHRKTVQVGQSSEADTAQAVTPARVVAVGQATETDTAQAVAHRKTVQVAQAVETDSAGAATPRHTAAVGTATETDTAGLVTSRRTIGIAQATETDSAQQIRPARTIPVVQATETDTAQAVSHRKTAHVGQAVEIDTAQTVAFRGVTPVAQAAETDTAQAITPRRTYHVGLAVETDAAGAVTGLRTVLVGQAVETDAALALATAQVVEVGQAAETDTAGSVSLPRVRIDEPNSVRVRGGRNGALVGASNNVSGVDGQTSTRTDSGANNVSGVR